MAFLSINVCIKMYRIPNYVDSSIHIALIYSVKPKK